MEFFFIKGKQNSYPNIRNPILLEKEGRRTPSNDRKPQRDPESKYENTKFHKR